MIKYLVGVDEAGRGPLAGPVSVGVVVIPMTLKPALNRYGVKDSKGLSVGDRERWYQWILKERRAGKLNFVTALVSARTIDERGIVAAVERGINRCLARLDLSPDACRILLDGSLRAPAKFKKQKTIIRGDETEPIIALASVAAKVRRDRLMIRLARKWPGYGFEVHKGYGTKAHYAALRRQGPSLIHRRTFLKGLRFRRNRVE